MAWAEDPGPSLHKLLSYRDQPPFPQSPSDLHACLLLPGHRHPCCGHTENSLGGRLDPAGEGAACLQGPAQGRLPLWTRPVSPALHSPPCPLSPTPSPQQSSSPTLQPVAWYPHRHFKGVLGSKTPGQGLPFHRKAKLVETE